MFSPKIIFEFDEIWCAWCHLNYYGRWTIKLMVFYNRFVDKSKQMIFCYRYTHNKQYKWQCDICHKLTSSPKNLRRHKKLHEEATFSCPVSKQNYLCLTFFCHGKVTDLVLLNLTKPIIRSYKNSTHFLIVCLPRTNDLFRLCFYIYYIV